MSSYRIMKNEFYCSTHVSAAALVDAVKGQGSN